MFPPCAVMAAPTRVFLTAATAESGHHQGSS